MKYKYYSTQRPIDIGTYPKPPEAPEVELVFYDQRKPVENGTALAWGELIYDAPLTPEQVSGYELRPSRDNLDIRERMGVQAQAVGAWEKRNHIPEEKRLTSWEPNMLSYLVFAFSRSNMAFIAFTFSGYFSARFSFSPLSFFRLYS